MIREMTVNYLHLERDVVRSTTYLIYIYINYQLIIFARACSHGNDFNKRNTLLAVFSNSATAIINYGNIL
jgi:hypothetical protein